MTSSEPVAKLLSQFLVASGSKSLSRKTVDRCSHCAADYGDSALVSWLLYTINTQLLPYFVRAETAPEIWATVLKFFSSRSTTTVMSLHYRLRFFKKGDQSMRALISDLEKIVTILNGLPMEYQPFVAVITASRDLFTLDAAITVLFDAETQLNSFNPLSEISPSLNVSVAGVTASLSSGRPYRSNAAQGGRARGKGSVKIEEKAANSRCLASQAHLANVTKSQWFVDSGASHHVSPDANNLLESSNYSGPDDAAQLPELAATVNLPQVYFPCSATTNGINNGISGVNDVVLGPGHVE
ncbi:hypothetical protein GQ457_04G028170 [Hibiscus cannabinus]